MPKMIEDPKFAAHTKRVAAERRLRAVERKRQATLRATTPGVATPASVMAFVAGRKVGA